MYQICMAYIFIIILWNHDLQMILCLLLSNEQMDVNRKSKIHLERGKKWIQDILFFVREIIRNTSENTKKIAWFDIPKHVCHISAKVVFNKEQLELYFRCIYYF